MKHYHLKNDLAAEDICYLLVKTGITYEFNFGKVDTFFYENDNIYKIYQGVKLWQNGCVIKIDGNSVDAAKVIIWFRATDKKPKLAKDYYHCFTADKVAIEIIDTLEENPVLGILNVWSFDMIKCYEFSEESWIKMTEQTDNTTFQAQHGGIKTDKSTLSFSIKIGSERIKGK